jgi:DNA/RNA-binding domain of Phe-tRNA-synthetase-like protein
MERLPFEVGFELEGWLLFWAFLERRPVDTVSLQALSRAVAADVRGRMRLETLPEHPTVGALRRLFRAAGCDPTRYRPSSEALLRRLLKGEEMPAISPLVDINNCLSAALAVPCCVMAAETLSPPFTFRAGRPGEGYQSLRGPFNLEGKPLLTDTEGPCDTPITGGIRVKVEEQTVRAWLVAYLPEGIVGAEEADRQLERLLQQAPAANIRFAAAVSSAPG